ncbi:junctional adhesion molecule A [Dendropsophus ebraccatus]|uniref:junctional adhesion molecule A n=1 Tax=Dendropsophus ebraccatus TaxID=150705 RepID=UPI003831BFF9
MATGKALCVLLLSVCAAVLGDTIKEVKEGQDVELSCNYKAAFSDPRIEWKFSNGDDSGFIYYNGALTASYKDRAIYYPQGLQLKSVTRKDTGEYVCEVTDNPTGGKPNYSEIKTQLVVLVPPSVPVAQVPTSVTIGSTTTMHCVENDGSPRPTITWYRNQVQLPLDPKSVPAFKNFTYIIDPTTGGLTFNPVTPADSGEYYCVATNSQGQQRSAAVTMEAYEKNVGGIVAAVIIVLLILALIGFGLWFAYSRGYIGKKAK